MYDITKYVDTSYNMEDQLCDDNSKQARKNGSVPL